MYSDFLTFIKKEKLLAKTDRLLLGVSGGVDSMVLAHLMLKLEADFGVAHVNYHLRGEASDLDAALVQEWCSAHGVAFYLKEVDPAVYDSDKSIQMIARDIRYAYYEELLQSERYTKIVTAHNANDNIETVLFNLTKGTGPAGLVGIAPRRGLLIRPLLFATKEAIYAYARQEGVHWREDHSNAKNDYSRNLIRNEVIPILKEINPSLEGTFQESLMRLKGAAELLDQEKQRIKSDYLFLAQDHAELKLEWVQDDHQSLLLISEVIRDYGFQFSDAREVFQALLNQRSGAVFYSQAYEISLDRARLFIAERKAIPVVDVDVTPSMTQVSIPFGHLQFEWLGTTDVSFEEEHTAFLNGDLIRYPLKVRTWREGDLFMPLGMSGKKKVSDFMIDSKIPVSLKRKVLVLESGGDILWVVGYRIDNRYRVTSETNKILKVQVSYA